MRCHAQYDVKLSITTLAEKRECMLPRESCFGTSRSIADSTSFTSNGYYSNKMQKKIYSNILTLSRPACRVVDLKVPNNIVWWHNGQSCVKRR